MLADVVVADEDSRFQDPHTNSGVVPGGGIQVAWQYLFAPNRTRVALIMGGRLTVTTAMSLAWLPNC